MSSDWPDAQLSTIQKTLQNSWQIPYISLFARIFCDTFQLFDFHQEELEDALLSDNPSEIHPFLQELLISLLSGLTRLHVNSNNMFIMLANTLKRCDLNVVNSPPTSLMSISDDTISTTDWQEMGIFEKVTVLRALCDARLNKAEVEAVTENMPADSLRFEPFGEDSRRNKYWYFGDTRLYRESLNKNSEYVKRSASIGRTSAITSTWECICRTLEEWNTFVDQFRKSVSRKGSNSKDRQLLDRFVVLTADLPDLYARKDRDRQRRWISYEPKRASTRLEAKRQQRLALEEITQEQKARHDRFLEYKRKQEETIAKEKERLERSERVRRREERADRIRRRTAAGSVNANENPELSENSNNSFTLNDDSTHALDTSDVHQRVLTLLRTNESSWPFLEPVTEDLAPNYFSIIEHPMDLTTIQEKINNKVYVNNSAEFIRDIELIVANCEQYNGKRSVLGRLANRLLRYFKECWSENQPITPQLEDDFGENPLKRRILDPTTTVVTRDKNNNTRTRKNYRLLAGLSDEDNDNEETEYMPVPSSKRTRHSITTTSTAINIDPTSPAFLVYHDHSYFIRHESSSSDNSHRRKTMPTVVASQTNSVNSSSSPKSHTPGSTSLTSVQVLNQLLNDHQQKNRTTESLPSSSKNSIDLAALLQAFFAKQKHQLSPNLSRDTIETNISETTSSIAPSAAAS